MSPSEGGTRKLADDQLESFDDEFVDPHTWSEIRRRIADSFGDGAFRFVDLGGGNGVFADMVLDAFPRAEGIVLDASRMLLDLNRSNPRKTCVEGDVAQARQLVGEPVDLVVINWVLHHLVGESYGRTRRHIEDTLRQAARLLSPRGRISVCENLYDGRVVDALPSRLIYALTSSRAIARVVRRAGANTAGVGVCFLSDAQWRRTFRSAGLCLEGTTEVPWPGTFPLVQRLALHLGDVRRGHYWLRAV